MRTWTSAGILFAAALVVSATASFAQRGMGRGPMNYDAATETTISGTVDEVKSVQPQGRGMGGIHIVLSAADHALEVHLGPAAFVASKGFAFTKGDAVTIIGSKVTMAGRSVLIAREVRKGADRLTLRDEKGFPLWSGRGAGRPQQ